MANKTFIQMPELSDAQIKYGILAYLANRYASTGKDKMPFCETRYSSRYDICVFLKNKNVNRYDLDRTLWDSKDRSKMLNPFHTSDKRRVEYLLLALESEGLVEEFNYRAAGGYRITKEGALVLGDALLAGTFDSKLRCGTVRSMLNSGQPWTIVPKVWANMPEHPLSFSTIKSTSAVILRKGPGKSNIAGHLDDKEATGIQ